MKVILFIMCVFIGFNCHAKGNYYTNLFTIEYKKSSDIIGQTINSRIPFIVKKGRYENCNSVDFFSESFDCLSNKESSHFVKMTIGTRLISYGSKKELKDAIRYEVYKEYRLVRKGFFNRFFSSPVPMVILKTRDGKAIEMDKLSFTSYILNDKMYQMQDDVNYDY